MRFVQWVSGEFVADRQGGTMIEYAVAMALLALMIAGGLGYFGMTLSASLDNMSNALK